jgi:anaerobic magnesium-protoporphyrin IX monomethyl ester cyclase
MSMPAAPAVLLQPPGNCRQFTRSGSVYPPLGLCQVAASVPKEFVVVLDADGLGWSPAETEAHLCAARPRLLGLTATTYTLDIVERWAAVAHGLGARVVAGGPHASLDPLGLLRACPSVEAAVGGEGELVFPQIVERALRDEPFDGLLGVTGRTSPANKPVPLVALQRTAPPHVEALALNPFPRVDDLPIENYWCPDARRRPLLTMMTARGCPHRCAFCSSPALLGRRLRAWDVDDVLDELTRWRHVLGVREVSFVDDVFTIKPARTLALCAGMVMRGLDLTWFCNARADQVTPEIASAMARAGCHQVYLGFESGSQRILDAIHKGATVDELEAGARHLADAGIARSVGFVIGLPGETDETVAASIALARRVRPERVQFTRFTPLPGTPLSESNDSTGFHARGDDRVGAWIAECYAECGGHGWGAESW